MRCKSPPITDYNVTVQYYNTLYENLKDVVLDANVEIVVPITFGSLPQILCGAILDNVPTSNTSADRRATELTN